MIFEEGTAVEELRPLKQALLGAYGHFADQRIKKIDNGHLFIVDNRTPADHGADGKLFLWFCLIYADVISPKAVEVTLRGGVPRSPAVKAWIAKNRADDSESGLKFKATVKDVTKLIALAEAFRSIVKPGARYQIQAYKYVCPRAAASLERLYATLSKHWAQEA